MTFFLEKAKDLAKEIGEFLEENVSQELHEWWDYVDANHELVGSIYLNEKNYNKKKLFDPEHSQIYLTLCKICDEIIEPVGNPISIIYDHFDKIHRKRPSSEKNKLRSEK